MVRTISGVLPTPPRTALLILEFMEDRCVPDSTPSLWASTPSLLAGGLTVGYQAPPHYADSADLSAVAGVTSADYELKSGVGAVFALTPEVPVLIANVSSTAVFSPTGTNVSLFTNPTPTVHDLDRIEAPVGTDTFGVPGVPGGVKPIGPVRTQGQNQVVQGSGSLAIPRNSFVGITDKTSGSSCFPSSFIHFL